MKTLTIGVVSDTHLPHFGTQLPAVLRNRFQSEAVDLIVHCGDWTAPLTADLLEAIAPLEGVAGNNDPLSIVQRFGERKILELGSLRIGVVHGHDGRGASTPDRAFNAFRDERVDAVLFGHSHQPRCERRDGVLLFNPGSPTDKRREPDYSFGLIRLSGGTLDPQIVRYADKSP